MRVRCFLRDLRGGRSLTDAEKATGINRGELSKIERGHLLPTDAQAVDLARFYGPAAGWYPGRPRLLADLPGRPCDECGEDLPPSATSRQRLHEACRPTPRTTSRAVQPLEPAT